MDERERRAESLLLLLKFGEGKKRLVLVLRNYRKRGVRGDDFCFFLCSSWLEILNDVLNLRELRILGTQVLRHHSSRILLSSSVLRLRGLKIHTILVAELADTLLQLRFALKNGLAGKLVLHELVDFVATTVSVAFALRPGAYRLAQGHSTRLTIEVLPLFKLGACARREEPPRVVLRLLRVEH